MASRTSFQLLDRSVRQLGSGEKHEFTDEIDAWIVTTLLLDGFLPKWKAREATQLSDAAIRQRLTRLTSRTGLSLKNSRDRGWNLDRSELAVDALEFLELVEGSAYHSAEARSVALATARGLWKSGLPEFPTLLPPAPDVYARVNLAHVTAMTHGRRILVVDDQIADAVADALRAYHHVCEVARSPEEYERFEPTLGTFDLVVLDRRLRTEVRDNTGDRIAERINSRPDNVPVFMMTYQMPFNADPGDWQIRLGLAGVFTKEMDGLLAPVDTIAQRINNVFREGAVELACQAIEMGMVRYKRQAAKLQTDRRTAAHAAVLLQQIDADADAVVARAIANDLAGARLKRGAFLQKYHLD